MKPETVSNTEHLRLHSKAQAMLERARCSPLFSATSYLHSAKGVTLSISLVKKQDYVAVLIVGAHIAGSDSKGKVPHKLPLLEGAAQLAEQVKAERVWASKQFPQASTSKVHKPLPWLVSSASCN